MVHDEIHRYSFLQFTIHLNRNNKFFLISVFLYCSCLFTILQTLDFEWPAVLTDLLVFFTYPLADRKQLFKMPFEMYFLKCTKLSFSSPDVNWETVVMPCGSCFGCLYLFLLINVLIVLNVWLEMFNCRHHRLIYFDGSVRYSFFVIIGSRAVTKISNVFQRAVTSQKKSAIKWDWMTFALFNDVGLGSLQHTSVLSRAS